MSFVFKVIEHLTGKQVFLYLDTHRAMFNYFNSLDKVLLQLAMVDKIDYCLPAKTPYEIADGYKPHYMKSVANHFTEIEKSIAKVLNNEPVYINRFGGWSTQSKDFKILGSIENDTNNFPLLIEPENLKNKIRVIRWKCGTHYYAKIEEYDVVVNGKQKWDTYKEAEDNAYNWLKQNFINVPTKNGEYKLCVLRSN
jgi:hypothetical protein